LITCASLRPVVLQEFDVGGTPGFIDQYVDMTKEFIDHFNGLSAAFHVEKSHAKQAYLPPYGLKL
jgi:hypothetical protein